MKTSSLAALLPSILILISTNAWSIPARAAAAAEDVHVPWCRQWKTIPLDRDSWEIAYDGFGQVSFDGGIRLAPKKPEDVNETHAALALLKSAPDSKRYAVRVRYVTTQALRGEKANPWETFWLFFDYKLDGKLKRTNYLIHKPNGMELGRAWNEIDQEFIATTSSPQAIIGSPYELVLVREENRIRALVDGKLALSTDKVDSLERGGRIGLYTEDAEVFIKGVELCVSR
jgi:hypothetical protein